MSDWSSDVCSSDLQPALLGRAVNEKPGVDRDAMTADPGTGLENIHARVTVGEADHLPDIDSPFLGHHRKLVGEGNVDVTIDVFDEFHHLGGAGRGGASCAAHELAKIGSASGREGVCQYV